jgi:hypothetical protein
MSTSRMILGAPAREVRFALDSPLEEAGFEPLVPPDTTKFYRRQRELETAPGKRAGSRNGDGRLELFVIGSDGNIYHIYQTRPNNGWSAWGVLMPLNVTVALQFSGLPTIVDAANASSPIQVFTVASDGTFMDDHPGTARPGSCCAVVSMALSCCT